MISASRGILGSLDLWLAAVIDFVHDQTVGPCTYCILIEQYKKNIGRTCIIWWKINGVGTKYK